MPSPARPRTLASTGARSTVLRSFANQASAPGPAIASSVAPADRQAEQLGDPPARQLPARSLVLEPDGRRERDPSLCGGGREVGRRHLDRIEQYRQRDRLAALEPGERSDDPRSGDVLCELPAGLSRDDLDGEPAPHELRLDMPLVDLAGELGELVVERSVVGLHRRRDLGAEEPGLQPFEAADGAEALALARGRIDRRRPVGLDAERRRLDRILLAAGGEHDRHPGDALGAALEQRSGLALRQPADVDARDLDAVARSAPASPRRQRRSAPSGRRGAPGRRGASARSDARRAVGHPSADRCRVDPHEPISVARALAVICYAVVKLCRASGEGTA